MPFIFIHIDGEPLRIMSSDCVVQHLLYSSFSVPEAFYIMRFSFSSLLYSPLITRQATSLFHNPFFIHSYLFIYLRNHLFCLCEFSHFVPLHCSPDHPEPPHLPNQPGPSLFLWLLWLLPHHEGVSVWRWVPLTAQRPLALPVLFLYIPCAPVLF